MSTDRIGSDVDVIYPLIAAMSAPRVLEIGTLRANPAVATHHKALAPNASEYVMTDIAAGLDVDVVADAHDLVSTFGEESFDVVYAASVWEHLERPWVAAAQVAAVLRPHGVAGVMTHQTFPLHGYPKDFFRFSTDALRVIFGDAGLTEVAIGYEFPCRITPQAPTNWNEAAPSWLNVWGVWRKPGNTR